jgi:2-oxoglutarate ferredoxin oxidoreductase subunit beta
MSSLDDYRGETPAWCPGCGNFGILKAFTDAVLELGLAPAQFTIVSGIGQAAKFPHYLRCNTFNGLHGRSLPVATALKLVNSGQTVIAVSGDGDCYGEGGNHLLHAMRRNADIKLFVHDNRIYGLTKGQASPTSSDAAHPKNLPFGVLSESLNPVALAIAMDCSLVARAFSGDQPHLKEIIKTAILHKGFSLVDILQPCVSFNRINTYEWHRQRVYRLGDDYDPEDRIEAFRMALEPEDRLPLGVLYRRNRPVFGDGVPVIANAPLVRQDQTPDPILIQAALKEFY